MTPGLSSLISQGFERTSKTELRPGDLVNLVWVSDGGVDVSTESRCLSPMNWYSDQRDHVVVEHDEPLLVVSVNIFSDRPLVVICGDTVAWSDSLITSNFVLETFYFEMVRVLSRGPEW